jgi:hypothetical protein
VKDRRFGLTDINSPFREPLQDFRAGAPYSIRVRVSAVEQNAPARFAETLYPMVQESIRDGNLPAAPEQRAVLPEALWLLA